MASGLLPICLGEATKFSGYMLAADKAYAAQVLLGATSTTGDAEGEITSRSPVNVTQEQLEGVIGQFLGDIMQIPPMYSALKRDGKPLYAYARAGETLDIPPRKVSIRAISMTEFAPPSFCISVRCSKGTYIRVLASDIGAALGCGASLSGLTRTQAGALELSHPAACTLEALQTMTEADRQARLLPVDTLLAALPVLTVDAAEAERLLLGQKLGLKHAGITGFARIYGPNQRFLGLVEVGEGGRTVPYRMLAQSQETNEASREETLEETPG